LSSDSSYCSFKRCNQARSRSTWGGLGVNLHRSTMGSTTGEQMTSSCLKQMGQRGRGGRRLVRGRREEKAS
jgi:hypothetical protein